MHRKHLVAAVAAVALAGTALGGPAGADAPEAKATPKTLAKDLLSPLSLAVTNNGTVFYSQNFAGVLNMKAPGRKAQVVYAAEVPGTEVGAVSVDRTSVQFATTFVPEAPEGEEPEGEPHTALMQLGADGEATEIADLWGYEEEVNPDGDVEYGFRDLPEGCEVPPFLQAYPGIVESHPYATTQHRGKTYIADAAMNAILKVGKSGKLSTVAVLPAQPLVITEAVIEALKAQELELPECTLGETIWLEPVPTDVEVGPKGKLYVTTLPGGPEDPSLGPRAAVYRVDAKTGKSKKVVGGLMSATGLAVKPNGNVYVAELFGGRIARIKKGATKVGTLLQAGLPGDVELRENGDIYATINVLSGLSGEEGDTPAGQVIRIKR